MPAWSFAGWLGLAAVVAGEDARALEDTAFERGRAGAYAASTELLAELDAADPGSERACLWQERAVQNAAAQGDPAALWGAVEELVRRWRVARGSRREDGLLRVCRNDVKESLRYVATRWHLEGDEDCDRERLGLAERAYRSFIAEFAGEAEVYEVQYWLAELLLARANLEARGPEAACHGFVCGNAGMRAQQERRARGEPAPRCGAFAVAPGEPRACPWLRAAQVAFVRVLELDPDGAHAREAAYAQLAMAAAITNHHERERGYLCRVNSDGVCVVRGIGPRGPACFEPTPECLARWVGVDRWPTATLSGVGVSLPPWRGL